MERRRAKELLALYTLEPKLRDIFVEGNDDVWIYKSICNKFHDVKFRPIGEIEILVEQGGNRARVIKLAEFLQNNSLEQNARCIIDRDNDSYIEESDILLVTDYSCLESYFYDDAMLTQVFNYYLKADVEWTDYKKSVNEILSIISYWRAKFKETRVNAKNIIGYVDVGINSVVFNGSRFNKMCISKGVAQVSNPNIDKYLDTDEEIRRGMNGHDFLCLLGMIFAKCDKDNKLKCPKLVLRVLNTQKDSQEFTKKYPLFKKIKLFISK